MSEGISFTEYCQIVHQWQEDKYPFVYDDELRQRIAVLDKEIHDLANAGDREAIKQRDFIEKLLIKPVNVQKFDLEEYLKERLLQFGISRRIVNLYAKQIKGESLEFEPPLERLGNYALVGNFASARECSGIQNKVQTIIDRFLSADKEPNITLRESLQEHPVKFKFSKGEFNACMNVCLIKKNLHPVLGIRIPDFSMSINEDLLATIVGHELGHWLDFGYRPQMCMFENGVMQESFADIVGCQVAKNASYDIEPFIDRVKGFITYFNEHKLPQYEICAQKRFGLLTKIFKLPQFRNVEPGKDERT
jgi:hypothetical protein